MSPTSFQLLYSAIFGALLECLDSIAYIFTFVNPLFFTQILTSFSQDNIIKQHVLHKKRVISVEQTSSSYRLSGYRAGYDRICFSGVWFRHPGHRQQQLHDRIANHIKKVGITPIPGYNSNFSYGYIKKNLI